MDQLDDIKEGGHFKPGMSFQYSIPAVNAHGSSESVAGLSGGVIE